MSVGHQIRPFQTCLSSSFDRPASFRPHRSKANKKACAPVPDIFLALPSSDNMVIGGNQEKGGHALDDDRRLKRFILFVLISPSYEEGFIAGLVVGCAFHPLLIRGNVSKWIS